MVSPASTLEGSSQRQEPERGHDHAGNVNAAPTREAGNVIETREQSDEFKAW